MIANKSVNVLGIMSGTSLDGLDMALCSFSEVQNKISYDLICAETIAYPEGILNKLAKAHLFNADKLWQLHCEYGRFLGLEANSFLSRNKLKADIISSHGHTIFHQPSNSFTTQIGDGASLAAFSGITTVCDFRSTDVALGGQGAPLVPKGELDLFNNCDAFLNLGGIANISLIKDNSVFAMDVCPMNQVLNFLASKLNLNYDRGGDIAASGIVSNEMLNELNNLDFYKITKSRSLGREWVQNVFLPVVEKYDLSVESKLATVSQHFAFQIATFINQNKIRSCMISGGGAYNNDFVQRLKGACSIGWIIPDDKIIQFKEALIFAYLGYLRFHNKINVLKSVTGASRDSCSGAIYLGVK